MALGQSRESNKQFLREQKIILFQFLREQFAQFYGKEQSQILTDSKTG